MKHAIEDLLTLELAKYPCFKKITSEQFYYLKTATKLYLVKKDMIPECINKLSKVFKYRDAVPTLNVKYRKICTAVKAEYKTRKVSSK